MTKTRLIGDVHGAMDRYLRIIEGAEQSVQVGDFGIGFRANPTHLYDYKKHLFIRGNHDWPQGCAAEVNWIPDGSITVIPDTSDSVMYAGGAWSIDWAYRTEHVSWWRDEELSQHALDKIVEDYDRARPKVMVTHEMPQSVVTEFGIKIFDVPSRTRDAFDRMLAIHRPSLWVGGHWHLPFDRVIYGTRFMVLDCDSWIDLDLAGDCLEGEQQRLAKLHYL
jgi:hypothetical protein